MRELEGRSLVGGEATAPALVIEPLSMWGGIDAQTGRIIDRHHPSLGQSVGGTVLVMAFGAGSSSSASVLAEALRNGVGPRAIVLDQADGILVLGASVASELYDITCPVLEVPGATGLIRSGSQVTITGDRCYVEDG